jgi:histidinol-phosphatase (PHP family)
MSWTNYHSHTNYSDGSDNPARYIDEAIKQGMHSYGFSCHAPVPFETDWCMKREKLENYFEEIAELKETHSLSINILTSLEIDYVPGLVSPMDELFTNSLLDYRIGSIHFVDSFPDGTPWGIDGPAEIFEQGMRQIWNGNGKSAVHRYYRLLREMMSLSKPDIIAHFDKIRMQNEGYQYFSEEENWYRQEVLQSLEVMHDAGSIMEVNTRGMYRGNKKEPYPSLWILKEAFKMEIPVVLSSDAHRPAEIIALFAETSNMLKEAGYVELYNLINGVWQPLPFNERGFAF